MKNPELEDLFPVGCVVSENIKLKLVSKGFGRWEHLRTVFDQELCKRKTEEAHEDMRKNPEKWFKGGHFCMANNLPPFGLICLFKRVE